MSVKSTIGRVLATTALLAGGVLAAAPAQAQVSADCIVGLSQNSVGQSRPVISCAQVIGGEARARADCTAAPDTYTSWVRSYQSSVGGYCLFGARGAILEVRAT